MMSIKEIERLCKQYAKEYWGVEIICPISINNRLKKTLGRFRHQYLKKEPNKKLPIAIEFSGEFLKNYKRETIISILKHEVCHYSLYMLGKPFSDGDRYFESELKRVGASSTRTIGIAGEVHNFKCKECDKIVLQVKERKAKNVLKNITIYKSKCCMSHIEYIGTEHKEDNFQL